MSEPYANQTVAPRVPHIESALNDLLNEINHAEQLEATMYERLTPVLAPRREDENKASGKPEEVLAPLASTIRTYAERLSRINYNYQKMISELEVPNVETATSNPALLGTRAA